VHILIEMDRLTSRQRPTRYDTIQEFKGLKSWV